MDDMEGGVAMIALQSGAPILPVYIRQTPPVPPHGTASSAKNSRFWISRRGAYNKETAHEVMERIHETYRRFGA